MMQEKTLGKKIDDYFTTHHYLKDLYQEHPLEFDGAARYFYTKGMMEAYRKSRGKKNERRQNNVSNIFDDGNANWVDEHPHNGLVDINKAVEWLNNNVRNYVVIRYYPVDIKDSSLSALQLEGPEVDYRKEEFLNDFKKVMEE